MYQKRYLFLFTVFLMFCLTFGFTTSVPAATTAPDHIILPDSSAIDGGSSVVDVIVAATQTNGHGGATIGATFNGKDIQTTASLTNDHIAGVGWSILSASNYFNEATGNSGMVISAIAANDPGRFLATADTAYAAEIVTGQNMVMTRIATALTTSGHPGPATLQIE